MCAIFALVCHSDHGAMPLESGNRLAGRYMPNPFIGDPVNWCCSAASWTSMMFLLRVGLLRSLPKGQSLLQAVVVGGPR